MGDVPFAGFDPIFWLHHAFVKIKCQNVLQLIANENLVTVTLIDSLPSGKLCIRTHTLHPRSTLMAHTPMRPERQRTSIHVALSASEIVGPRG